MPARGDRGPVKSKPSPTPAHDGLRSDNQQGSSPVTPDLGQPDPKPAIHPSQPGSRTRSFHHRQQLAKGEVLQGDLPDIPWQSEHTYQPGEKREPGDEYRRSHAEKSIIFRRMPYWRSTGRSYGSGGFSVCAGVLRPVTAERIFCIFSRAFSWAFWKAASSRSASCGRPTLRYAVDKR